MMSEFSVMVGQLTKAPPVYVGRPDWRGVKVKKESKSSAPPKGKPIDRYLASLRKRRVSSAADLAADMGISDIAVRKFMRENANINTLTTMIVRKMKDGRTRYAWKLK